MKKSALFFTVALVPLDLAMLFLAGVSAYFLRTSSWVSEYRPVLFDVNLPLEKYIFIVLIVIPFGIFVFALTGLYKLRRDSLFEEFFQIIASVSFTMMSAIIFIFIKREWFDSRFILLAAWIFSVLYVFSGRLILRMAKKFFISRYQFGVERVLLVGDDKASKILAQEIGRNSSFGYKLVKIIPSLDLIEVKKAIANPKIDTVMVGKADYSNNEIVELAEFCQEHHLNFHFAPTLFQTLATNVNMNVIGGMPLIEVRHTPLYGWGKVLKRSIDIAGSLIGLFILAPLLGVISLAIKITSKGPVFFAPERVSMNNKFHLYKFRSMINDAHYLKKDLMRYNERKDGPLFKMKNDPRVTGIGRFLRRTRLDELPQLFNVLKGDISLVGPRPHEPEEISRYEKRHKKLLTLKAGVTGMAQISGSSDLPFEEEVKLDIYYIENWSLFLDIKILFKTLAVLFKDKSAC